jgi:hypothetical protein
MLLRKSQYSPLTLITLFCYTTPVIQSDLKKGGCNVIIKLLDRIQNKFAQAKTYSLREWFWKSLYLAIRQLHDLKELRSL